MLIPFGRSSECNIVSNLFVLFSFCFVLRERANLVCLLLKACEDTYNTICAVAKTADWPVCWKAELDDTERSVPLG